MTQTAILLKETNESLDRTNQKLDAIKALYDIEEGIRGTTGKFSYADNVHLDTVFENEFSTVSHVVYDNHSVGHPLHCHKNLIEYLICTKGSFVFKIGDNFKILKVGDCARIDAGFAHTTIPLESGAELLAVCIPPEDVYRKRE